MTQDSTSETSPSSNKPKEVFVPTWKLPPKIEEHIESGLVKTASGVLVGGIIGALLFKSGKGWRYAGAAMGAGVAAGSTVERAISNMNA